MSQEQPRVFVERICERTLASKIQWEKTSTESVFQAILAGYIVRFRHDADGNQYIIELYNSDNELVDKFDDQQFDCPDPEYPGPPEYPMFTMMERAFAAARRKAMGIEDALNKILRELQDDNAIPF